MYVRTVCVDTVANDDLDVDDAQCMTAPHACSLALRSIVQIGLIKASSHRLVLSYLVRVGGATSQDCRRQKISKLNMFSFFFSRSFVLSRNAA